MTDTTDTKALREECAQWVKDTIGEAVDTRMALNGDGNDYMSWDMHVIWLAWQHLSGKLEAERQRAADLVLHVNTQANMREKAEAELAELKAKLANPVVLQDFHAATIQSTQPFNLFDVIVATQVSDAKAIRAAGFTVKGDL